MPFSCLGRIAIYIPSLQFLCSQSSIQNKKEPYSSHLYSTSGAPAPPIPPIGSRHNFPRPRPHSVLQPPHSPSHAWMLWRMSFGRFCSQNVQEALLNSGKPSTRITYLAKYKCFSIWSHEKGESWPAPILPCWLAEVAETRMLCWTVF